MSHFSCECSPYLTPWVKDRVRKQGNAPLHESSLVHQVFCLTRQKFLCNCLQASEGCQSQWCQTCVFVLYSEGKWLCGFFFYCNICNLSSKYRLFLKGILYLWDTHFCLFLLVFFKMRSLLYVYSLNKSDTVCKVVSPVFFFVVQRRNHKCWTRQ